MWIRKDSTVLHRQKNSFEYINFKEKVEIKNITFKYAEQNSIKFIESVITQLDNRVKTMNNDILKIDQEVSEQLGIPIDTERVARADGKSDARKD